MAAVHAHCHYGRDVVHKWGRYVVAAFDINSDSYVLFPCHVDFFPPVEMLGRIVGGMFAIVGRG